MVPKRDEFRCTLRVFGITTPIDDLPLLRNEKYPVAHARLGELYIALVLIDDQSNSASSAAAGTPLRTLQPTHILPVGTAAGNSARTAPGDVRFAERVLHVREWVSKDGEDLPRIEHHSVRNGIRRDMGSVVDNASVAARYKQDLYAILIGEFADDSFDATFNAVSHRLALGPLISADILSKSDVRMQQIWRIDDRAEFYDMESGGLAEALAGEPDVYWGAIRGISDSGDSQKESVGGMRDIAAYAAAVAAKLFCSDGLSKSHPSTVRPNLLLAPRLADSQYYAENSSNYILEMIEQELGITLPQTSLARHISFKQFATMVRAYSSNEFTQQSVITLDTIRRSYYREKYLDYSYEKDIRGHFESWWEEFREVLAINGREYLSGSRVINVGIGNGEELRDILTDAMELWGVDIHPQILERAQLVRGDLRPILASADDLNAVPDQNFDLYVALRSLVCRFIDVELALAEALRVLRPGGLCVVSIPNGYREWRNGESVVVRGLKEPGGTDFVDPMRPHDVMREYVAHMIALGFEK